jgi:hypothetical protein
MTTSSGSVPPPGPLSYTGEVVVPFIRRTFDPTTSFNTFAVPTIWINTSTSNAFILVSKSQGVAIWAPIGGLPGAISTITTPDSVVVIPTNGNITFSQSGPINITGSGSNIAFDVDDSIATTYVCDVGNAVPSNFMLTLTGGSTGLIFSGATSVVTLTGTLGPGNGGTGASGLVGIIQGNGASPMSGSNLGVTGNTIVSLNTNGDIDVVPNGTGSFKVTVNQGSGGVQISGNLIGQTLSLSLANADNTNTSSNSRWENDVGGPNGGDPYFECSVVGANAFQWGIDNSDSDSLKETTGANGTPSTGTLVRKVTTSGQQTLPLQPSFSAYVNADITNTTGNGAFYVITANWTTLSNVGGAFSSGVFTAPVTGIYQFNATVNLQNLTGVTGINFQFLFGGQSIYFYEGANIASPVNGRMGVSGSCRIPLTAGNTIAIRVQGLGAPGNTATVTGSSSPLLTCFSGALVS